jgi:hypothetical protein
MVEEKQSSACWHGCSLVHMKELGPMCHWADLTQFDDPPQPDLHILF